MTEGAPRRISGAATTISRRCCTIWAVNSCSAHSASGIPVDQADSLDRLFEKVCDLVAPFFGVVDRHFCGLIRTLFDVSTRI